MMTANIPHWVGAFVLSIAASVVVNLLFLSVALWRWISKRRMKWFWGPFPNKRVQIVFSLIRDLDDPAQFRTRRFVAHLGDAQAAALVHSFLRAELSAEATLATDLTSPDDGVSFVGIGGPRLNEATGNILETLSHSWQLPFVFAKANDRWIIRGPHNARYETSDRERYVTRDFGIVAKLPHPGSVAQSTGSGSARPVCLLLAGISTFGTLAAARFALDLSCVKSMREKLVANGGRNLPYFIAIISSTPNAQYTGVDMSSTQLIDVQPVARGLKA
jgi:hypothetical protein